MQNPSQVSRPEQVVFAGALECATPVERAAYLEGACGRDVVLRERVEALLKASDAVGEFLEAPPTAFVADEGQSLMTSDGPLEKTPDGRIGSYRLLERIGEGGCGSVYMAEQERPIRRRVALKVIKAGMDTRAVVARFEAERQALALMDHPNIARVYDGGETPGGRPYFVMELVRGIRITEFCTHHGCSREQRLKLFLDVCQAIQHAHQKGVIHRDIKPANILVTVNDGVAVPKVIDFGIAKAIFTPLTDRTLFTHFHSFLGTPAYTSPEQAGMSSVDIDTRSDIYSLGVLLFELLTGRTPFDGEELVRSGIDEMRRIIRDVDPPRPSAVLKRRNAEPTGAPAEGSIGRRCDRGGIPADLDWIVMKCLEKDRDHRYATVTGLAADIRRHLANEPVLARPPGPGYLAGRWIRRNRVPAAAATLVVVAVVAGLGTSWVLYQRELQARKGEEIQRARAQRESVKGIETARFLGAMLSGIEPEQALGRDVSVLISMLEEASRRIDTECAAHPEVEASIRGIIGRVYRVLGRFPQASDHLGRTLALRSRLFGPAHEETLQCRLELADLDADQGRLPEAEASARKGFEDARNALGASHVLTLEFQERLAIACLRQRKFAEAEREITGCAELRRESLGADHLDSIKAQGQLAAVHLQQRRFAQAAEILEVTVVALRQRLPEGHPGLLQEQANLAAALQGLGKLDFAESLLRSTWEASRRVHGAGHPRTLVAMQNLGSLLSARGLHDDADKLLCELIALAVSSVGPEHPSALRAMEVHGFALGRAGRHDEAESVALRLLEIHARVLGAEHPRTLRARGHIADALVRQPKRRAEACRLYRETLDLQNRVLGADHPDVLLTAGNLLLGLRALDRWEEAATLCRETHGHLLRLRGGTDPATREWAGHLAEAVARNRPAATSASAP